MSDLISRSALIQELKTHFDAIYRDDGELLSSDHVCISEDVDDLIKLVEDQPTAYDIDKVVERLEATKDVTKDDTVAEQISTNIWNKALSRAIRIVKGGGISE